MAFQRDFHSHLSWSYHFKKAAFFYWPHDYVIHMGSILNRRSYNIAHDDASKWGHHSRRPWKSEDMCRIVLRNSSIDILSWIRRGLVYICRLTRQVVFSVHWQFFCGTKREEKKSVSHTHTKGCRTDVSRCVVVPRPLLSYMFMRMQPVFLIFIFFSGMLSLRNPSGSPSSSFNYSLKAQ